MGRGKEDGILVNSVDDQIAIGCILDCSDPSTRGFHDTIHGALEFVDRKLLSQGTAMKVYNEAFQVGSATLRSRIGLCAEIGLGVGLTLVRRGRLGFPCSNYCIGLPVHRWDCLR